MVKDKIKAQRLVYLGILFSLLLNYPIMSTYNKALTIMGLPLLYVGAFALWIVLIVLLAMITK